jgi:PKHD-type hydroxylase
MQLILERVLNDNQLRNVRQTLAGARFVDGRLSAGQDASRVKNNEELAASRQVLELLNTTVMAALNEHEAYRAGALPLRAASPIFARYVPGMRYGDHVDDPVMGAPGPLYRSDVSVTVFLSEPDEYDGGELVVNSAFGQNRIKLPAGDAVVYPSSSLHHVAEVSRGERLVAITWIQSLIRDPARRELLYTLYRAKESLLASSPNSEEAREINTAYVNLIRMWGEV